MGKGIWRSSLALIALVLSVPVSAQGDKIMALELPTLEGDRFVRLDDFAGRALLLNFWGSECPPCVKELPLLFTQASRHPGLTFLGVAVDQRANAKRFLQRKQVSYLQLLASSQPEVLMRRFGNKLGALPYTVVLNSRHQVCTSRVGEVDAAWIDAAAKACIAEHAAP
jgi:thiol-disulfide isomerase/thioredoxin